MAEAQPSRGQSRCPWWRRGVVSDQGNRTGPRQVMGRNPCGPGPWQTLPTHPDTAKAAPADPRMARARPSRWTPRPLPSVKSPQAPSAQDARESRTLSSPGGESGKQSVKEPF